MNERKRKLFIILGIIIVITPFLGIPFTWKTIVFVLAGLWIAFTAFFIGKNLSSFKEEIKQTKKEPVEKVIEETVEEVTEKMGGIDNE